MSESGADMSTMQPKCPSDDAVDVMAKEVRPPLQQQDGHQAKGTTKEKPRRNLSNEPGGDSGTRGVGGSGGGGGGGGGKLMHLVVDSAAIIKGAAMTLAAASENFWTVPEVITEIRDKKARHNLDTLPFELKLKEPSDEAIKFAANFARQTGDLRALSQVDLKVIALTYMLERQETGAAHLRTSPVKPGTKVNTKGKEVATTTVAAAKKDTPKTSDVSAQPAGHATMSERTEEGSSASNGGMESLCDQVKQAWTANVINGTDEAETKVGTAASAATPAPVADVVQAEASAGEVGGEVKSMRVIEVNMEGQRQTVTGGDGNSEGRAENEQDKPLNVSTGEESTEQENGIEEGAEGDATNNDNDDEGDDDDDDDDDDWEPENAMSGQTEQEGAQKQPLAVCWAPTGTEVTEKASFTADDFPALGGKVETAAPTPVSDTTAPASTAQEPVSTSSASASSWSLMARSNPAPFKAPVKADPTPLPAAATPIPHEDPEPTQTLSGVGAQAIRARPDGAAAGSSRILNTASGFGVTGRAGQEDDGEGWVNPSNIKSRRMAGLGLNGPSQSQHKGAAPGAAAGSKCRAGCVTTDFAMQNVILQVGLPLLSLDGMAVRQVKQWILRCSACFRTCTEMGRLFCPVCGNAGLSRVACSVNAKSGAMRVHLRKNYKVNLRGTKYSIPHVNPSKGRFEGDILLREDQLLSGIWAQKARRKDKNISSMFGENITENVGLSVSKSADIVVGYGRKNPNSARGRERRGKKRS